MFGLYHGLVALPVFLAMMGPQAEAGPYKQGEAGGAGEEELRLTDRLPMG